MQDLDDNPNLRPEPRAIGDVLWFLVPVLLFLLFALAVWTNATSAGEYPLDFVVFHGAGSLFADGAVETAYDSDAFTSYLVDDYGLVADESTVAHFLNPPPFGWFAQVLAMAPIGTSSLLWTVTAVMATIGCCLWLGLPKQALPLIAISPMFVKNLALGQTGAIALVVTVAIHHFLTTERPVPAGAVAGAFILKPPLAIGYGILWLIKGRRYGASILAALGTGLVLCLPMARDGLSPWRAFVETTVERTDLDDTISGGSSFSLPEFVKEFVGDAPTEFTLVVWAVALGLGAIALLGIDRRYNGDVELLSATASLVTVLFSPHVLAYDSLILLIPLAVGVNRGALNVRRAGLLSLIIGVGVTSRLFVGGPNINFVALLLCSALLYWWIDTAEASSGESGVAIGADSSAVDRQREDLFVGE